ncbi:MAG: GNAT family N-acetyltransferase, partial [Bryobacterales bacterium]|nr:GNAT family N-acetyltransferase [Bryobacterales bacterium]
WPDYTQSPDDSREFIRKCVFEYAHQQTMACGIWYGSRFAGGMGAHLDCANRTASVGYWIDHDLEGKGIVIRATEAMIRYLFAHWACNRIEIRCATENTRSRAIPERLGFRNEGTLRSAFLLRDRVLDIVVYSMLRAEWDAATARGPE